MNQDMSSEIQFDEKAENDSYPQGSVAADLKSAFDKAKLGHGQLQQAHEGVSEFKVPEHWSEEDKAAFDVLDPKARAWLVNRHRAMEGDYTRKTQEVSKERKKLEKLSSLERVLDAYRQDLQESGVDEAGAVAELFDAYKQLKADPQGTLKALADRFGVRLSAENGIGAKSTEVQTQLDWIKQTLQAQAHQQWKQSIQRGRRTIDDFLQQKNEAGESIFPDFEQLLPEIILLARSDLMGGRQPDLKDLYERACWSNPKTRDKQLSAQQKAAEAEKKKQARQKAEAARKAGASIYGSPAGDGVVQKPARTLREELEAAFRGAI